MNRFSKIAFLAAASLAVMGVPALADSADPPADGDAGGGGAAGGGAAPAAGVGATAEGPTGAWTQQIIDRPLTVKKSMIAPFVDLPIAKIAGATGIGIQVGADYGVSDKLQVGAAYGFGLKDFEIKGTLTGRVGLSLISKEKMKAAAVVDAGFNLNGNTVAPIDLGVNFLYKLAPKFAVFTPGGQLPIGLDPDTSIAISLPVGVQLQATPMINVQALTNIAKIGISPSGNQIFGADVVPLTVAGFYSPSNKMDFGVSFQTDIKNSPGDAFVIGVVARLFSGGGI